MEMLRNTQAKGPTDERLKARCANLTFIHGPVHASRLNQIEIYFSLLQRKAITLNDFPSFGALKARIWLPTLL